MNKIKTLSINKQEDQLNKVWMFVKDIIPYLGLLSLLILFGTTTNGRFLRVSNIGVILKQSAIVLVGTMGTTFVMAHGNLDFSLGGELALCSLA
ncbi:MAG: ABC transporter permease, partial [Clostridiaceae bacterium]|nr:ABC transporter permease [Clostridiaceae bacterium]